MQLSQINIYPLKSAQANSPSTALVTERGLINDRRWALIGTDHAVLTGRKYPQLLDLKVLPTATGLEIYQNGQLVQSPSFPPTDQPRTEVQVFSNTTTALAAANATNQWFSNYLNTAARLVFMDENSERKISEQHEGNGVDVVSLADEAPILLVSTASLGDLNSRLEQPVTMAHFRPNLVVENAIAFAEDHWQHIRIGEAEFKAGRQCQRCVFTTIDPQTKQQHPRGEPLRTLSIYRKGQRGGVMFGQHFIPTRLGEITVGDKIEVL